MFPICSASSIQRVRRSCEYSTPCITVTAPAITNCGHISRPFRGRRGRSKSFEYGSLGLGAWFGARFAPQPGEIVASEHWCSSGFANTDLDLQLKKHGIRQLIVILV